MLTMSSACEADIQWMFSLFVQAANKGHFMMRNNAPGREQHRRNIESIVTRNEIIDYALPAYTFIYSYQRQKAGYAVVSDTPPGLEGKEIVIFVVDPQQRGKGYGRFMLDHIIQNNDKSGNIYARCLPASRVMAGMLSKAGFHCLGVNRDRAEVYRLDSQASADHLLSA